MVVGVVAPPHLSYRINTPVQLSYQPSLLVPTYKQIGAQGMVVVIGAVVIGRLVVTGEVVVVGTAVVMAVVDDDVELVVFGMHEIPESGLQSDGKFEQPAEHLQIKLSCP